MGPGFLHLHRSAFRWSVLFFITSSPCWLHAMKGDFVSGHTRRSPSCLTTLFPSSNSLPRHLARPKPAEASAQVSLVAAVTEFPMTGLQRLVAFSTLLRLRSRGHRPPVHTVVAVHSRQRPKSMCAAHTESVLNTLCAGENCLPGHSMAPSMPAPRDNVSISIRMSRAVAERLRTFARDRAGKPDYIKIGPFVEDAVTAAMDKIENGITVPSEQSQIMAEIRSGRNSLNGHRR